VSIVEKKKTSSKVNCPGRRNKSIKIDFDSIPDKNDLGWKCRMLLGKIVALALILLLLPVLIVVGLLIKLSGSGPIFYAGDRLGYKMKIFQIYKFRTLPVGSQEKIGGEVFNANRGAISTFGKFLRDTRIDELPQLINVLQGTMVLVGPRPVRPEIYNRLCLNIPKYEMRFMLYPGLVGYAQLFTPHGTPKHIRAYINNHLYLYNEGILKNLKMIFYGAWILIRNMIRKSFKVFTDEIINKVMFKKYHEKRTMPRISFKEGDIEVANLGHGAAAEIEGGSFRIMKFDFSGVLKDINETHFRFCTDEELGDGSYLFRLEAPIRVSQGKRSKRAYCRGKVVMKRNAPAESGCKYEYVVIYKGESALQCYFIEKYFLELSIA
jgi:lipopolysaccharide/colanic/teichoic acid biosynthesis glycosyltransferase